MATAAQLNAASTITNGNGLAANASILSAITTFQNQSTFTILQTIFDNAVIYPNVANLALAELNNLGTGATQGQFLLDLYPSNITPVSSTTVAYRFGSLASASGTIQNQVNGPFNNGMAGFANVMTITQGYASSVLDTAGSLYILKDKTYGQSGLAYNGLNDLVTNGIGLHAGLLGNVISGWGTMYNITNINLIADPYVFGQNLLDHGFGNYGNLSAKLTATGLDVEDITKVPATATTLTQESSTLTTQTLVGEVDLPTISNVSVTNTVTGNSPSTVIAVYETITGEDLDAIISATGFVTTGTSITTLADFLVFNKAITSSLLSQLSAIGITNFAQFTKYLNSRVGQSNFQSWSKLGTFLGNVEVPVLTHTTTTASSNVLLSSTITTLNNLIGPGSGPFDNPVMLDYLGATSGTPYNTHFGIINNNFSSISPTIVTALDNVNSAVLYTNQHYVDTIVPDSAIPPAEPNGDGADGEVDVSGITTAVAAVTTALNALSGTALNTSQNSYYIMLNKLTKEVTSLTKAGAIFGSASTQIVFPFGQRIGSLGGKDPAQLGIDKIIANLITDDVYGDTIHAVIAEHNNINILSTGGISMSNDPLPLQALSQSQSLNIPLSTYLSQNK